MAQERAGHPLPRGASPPAPVSAAARPATVIEPARLGKRLGVELTLCSETFQHTGSFKFRAAYNLAANVENQTIITESSGNFGQALALACRMVGKSCIVVMPSTSARVKVDAVLEYGGRVELTDVRVRSRAQRRAELAEENPEAFVASAYDSPLVIEGNATLGEEICALGKPFDDVIVPVGGGGLSSGIIVGVRRSKKNYRIWGAEPLMANDAARSLREGRIVCNEQEPQTIADGARVLSIGKHNWEILRDGLAGIVEVPEPEIIEAVRLLFTFANLKCEPTGALSVAALLARPEAFAGRRVCCVVSGGNVDQAIYSDILNGKLT